MSKGEYPKKYSPLHFIPMIMNKKGIFTQIITIILVIASTFCPLLLCITIPWIIFAIRVLYDKIECKNELLDVMYQGSSRALIGQSCLSKALNELARKGEKTPPYKRLDKWLELREQLISKINKDCEAKNNKNLKEVYVSAIDICSKIYSEEIDIDRN